jgi:hypothetical protein
MNRADLRMTASEVRSFLGEHRVGLLSGHDATGRLTARRGTYELVGDMLLVAIQPPKRCFDLSVNDWLCLAVDIYPSWLTERIKCVVVHGPARWVDGEANLTLGLDRIVSFDFSKGTP